MNEGQQPVVQPASSQPASSQAGSAKPTSWGTTSRVFRFAEMPRRVNANGSESRDVGGGAIATGERVRVHETTQPAGLPPNPAHRIDHTEFLCIREGTVEFTLEGVASRAEVGDVVMVAKGTLHSLRNVGSGPASYFVVAVGGDVWGAS